MLQLGVVFHLVKVTSEEDRSLKAFVVTSESGSISSWCYDFSTF